MQDRSSDKVVSPPKTVRVEDGKIRKIRSANRSDSTAIQHFNGKTYACESCKRGHRVQKCDHGKTRPISETNQPGRPSGGQKRGCNCPRNCACTTKTCKCQRDCACTQEMYVIVRVDGPQTINRESTSSPRPVWEDDNGVTMTLKKVWADANGREIDDEEYQARQRRKKEREQGITPAPEEVKSSCCGTPKPKAQPASTPNEASGGCRHRQNVTITQPRAGHRAADPAQIATSIPNDAWVAACSCGSGCSCLYCPDHPNNETSIKHTQQQVKNLAEQASVGEGLIMPASFMPVNDTRSCMGGRPSFFISRTPGVSQQQLEQFFAESADPDAIYLTYPIQQHSWTNQPVSAHCSQVQSPAGFIAQTPDPIETDIEPVTVEPVNDLSTLPIPWDLLPNDSTGTWNFSNGQMGNTSFSWTDLDASRGTDYSIGQARVASMANWNNLIMPSTSSSQQVPRTNLNLDSVARSANLHGLPTLDSNGFGNSCCQFDLDNGYVDFDVRPAGPLLVENVQSQGETMTPVFPRQKSYGEMPRSSLGDAELQSLFEPQPHVLHRAGLSQQITAGLVGDIDTTPTPWDGYEPLTNSQAMPHFVGMSGPGSPPIRNGV